MSLIFYIVILFFLFGLINNYSKYIIIACSWSLFLRMLCIGNLSLFGIIIILAIVIGVLRYRDDFYNTEKYPFILCSLLFMSSIVFTNYFSSDKHWGMSIFSFIVDFGSPYLLWISIKDEERMHLAIKHIVIFSSLLVLYGLFEVITRYNPFIEYAILNQDMFGSGIGNSTEIRFGFKRIQSFLPYCGALGCYCSQIILVLGYIIKYHIDSIFTNQKYLVYLLIGCIFCVLFTGTRSVILCLFVASLYFLKLSYIIGLNKKQLISIFLVSVIILVFCATYANMVVSSITDTQSVGGSNTEMRQNQFEISLFFLMQKPIFGNGIAYTWVYVKEYVEEIYGAESVWFPLMIEQGLYGILCYLLLLISPCIYALKNKYYIVVFSVLSFVCAKTLSSIPGVPIVYHILIIVILIKLCHYSKDKLYQYD